MIDSLWSAIIQNEFMPHGICIKWTPELLTAYVISDGLIALSYFSIPIALIYSARKRKDLSWAPILRLFAAFILACGTTHLLSIFIIWTPIYWLDVTVKALTALISVITVFYLLPRIPGLLTLPSPEQLLLLNRQLSDEIEQRKAVEAELRSSEERWKFALESGADGVWDWDLVTGNVYLSPRCMEILDFNETDRHNQYQDWEKTLHPEDHAMVMHDLHQHLENATVRFSNEHRVKTKSGGWRWILTRGLVVSRTPDGKALRMIGTQTDITERKQFQWLQLNKIINGSAEGMVLVAENGAIQLCNDVAAKLFGYQRNDLIGLNVDKLVPISSRAMHAQYRQQFMQENKSRSMSGSKSLKGLKADGSEFSVEISLVPIDIDNQRSVIASVTDVTERRRIEHEMQLMAMIYQAIGEAVMVADAEGNIVAVNEAFTRLTGYSEKEAVGQSTSLLKSGKHEPDFYQALWHALNETGHWQGEIWNRRKNGELYHEWLVINTIYSQEGEVERRVAMFSQITERKQIEQSIWRHANFDPLTNLVNRRMFSDRLNQEIIKAQRDKRVLAVMLLDLDNFKEINDTMGHSTGDQLLQETAKRIQLCVRRTDTVARLGGDEFTVILSELKELNDSERVAKSILQKLADPFLLNGELAYISASIGITLYPEDALNAEELVKNADQAMYHAKQLGKNCFSYFTVEMEQSAQKRLRLGNDLRKAVKNNEFLVHYQPIVNLRDHSVRKAEALIRWRHPQRGLVSPAEFIPLSEKTGLINEIGDWVFHTAARQAGQWREQHCPDFKISINKSPMQITRGLEHGEAWLSFLDQIGLPGECIIIEITEGLLLDVTGTVSEQLFLYRDSGIQVAIDDFGTGYSSLAYLKKFHIDYLKIDQSFTRNLVENSNELVLCEAIIVMAHKLGLQVIAEGIETQHQLDLLKQAGCDFGQGYYFAKPMPAELFATCMADGFSSLKS